MSNILITSAGRRVSLVSFFKKEAQLLLGEKAKVFAVDICPEMSSACLASSKGFKVLRCTDLGYMDQIMSICKANDIKLVIPTIDTELQVLAKHRGAFQKEGIQLVISDTKFVQICRDKRKMNRFFEKRGFQIPKPIDRYNPTFPLFIKPIDGSNSQNIFFIKDSSMLSDYQINNKNLMFLEYLPKERYEEYTIDLYYDNESNLKCVVPRIRIAVVGGETNKGITQKNRLIRIVKEKLNKIEGARGCLTLQVFEDRESEDVYGIEINPRFGGGYPLSYLAGANYPAWLIQEYLLNKTIPWFDNWEDRLLLLRHDNEMIVHDFEYKR